MKTPSDLVDILEGGKHKRMQIYPNEVFIKTLLKIQEEWCVGCGNCCIYTDYVQLTIDDYERIRKHLRLGRDKLGKHHGITPNKFGYKLETPCVFIDESKHCSIYEARPFNCRGYPYGKYMAIALKTKSIVVAEVEDNFECKCSDKICEANLSMLKLLENFKYEQEK